MKLLYVGCFVEPSQSYFIEKKSKATVSVSASTFQKAFLSGFNNSVIKPQYIINAPEIGSWPQRCKSLFIPRSKSVFNGIDCENVCFLNITYLKKWSVYHSLKKSIYNWVKKNKDDEVIIVTYSLLYPYLKASVDIKASFPNVRICCIVLDLPEYFGDNDSLLYKLFKSNEKKIYELSQYVDSYVLLTEHMKYPLEIENKPWLLMEGIYAPRNSSPEKKQKQTILYSGKLDSRFGIRDLIDNFRSLKNPNYRLWICGNGLDKEYVEKNAKEDPRIVFWGQVEQEKVFRMQRQANLLINPRKPEGEFTKYSFPSKTMEYMASGTPTLMYRLPGMPQEYEDNVVLFKDSLDSTFCSVLEEWLNKPQEELDVFGLKAQEFIMNNKTSEKQIKRFVSFILNSYGE